jgi:hypothetical protein
LSIRKGVFIISGNRPPSQFFKSDEQKTQENVQSTESQPSKLDTHIQFTAIPDEPTLSPIDEDIDTNHSSDQDLQSFLNLLLSYLKPDSLSVYSTLSDQIK